MEYKIGGKVVALNSHEEGCYKEGNIYDVLGVRTNNCSCKPYIVIKIRRTDNGEAMRCSACGEIETKDSNWFAAQNFIPITEDLQAISYTKVIQEVNIGSN